MTLTDSSFFSHFFLCLDLPCVSNMKVSIYRTQILDERKSHSQARFFDASTVSYRGIQLQRARRSLVQKALLSDSFRTEWRATQSPTSPAVRSPLTGQRFHVQLRLLGVHIVLRQRVEVRKHEAQRARRGAQLPQCVRSRLLGLGSNQAFGKSSQPRHCEHPERRYRYPWTGGSSCPLSYCSVLLCPQAGCAKGPKNILASFCVTGASTWLLVTNFQFNKLYLWHSFWMQEI